jgi:MFS family permease
MGVYVIGTLFGTFIFAILASLFASANLFDPRALAMACGIGSGSMMAACTGALTEVIPSMKDEILALAGASNLLTYATGLYAGLFLALPIVEKLYDATAGKKDLAAASKKEG